MKFKIGIPGFVASLLFMVGAIINLVQIFRFGGFLGFDIAVIAGAMGLIVLSLINVRGKKKERVPFVLTMLIPAVFCIRNVLFNVSAIGNTVYLARNIAYILTFVFMLLLFKNAYAPTRHSDTILYTFSLLNFTFSGMGMLAFILSQSIRTGIQLTDIFSDAAFVAIGVYSLLTVFNLNNRLMERNAKTTKMMSETDLSEDLDLSQPEFEQPELEGAAEDSRYADSPSDFYDNYKNFFTRTDEQEERPENENTEDVLQTEEEDRQAKRFAALFSNQQEEIKEVISQRSEYERAEDYGLTGEVQLSDRTFEDAVQEADAPEEESEWIDNTAQHFVEDYQDDYAREDALREEGATAVFESEETDFDKKKSKGFSLFKSDSKPAKKNGKKIIYKADK